MLNFDNIMKNCMILVLPIIILISLSVLKLVWSKNNASMNFRGGKMLEINSVQGKGSSIYDVTTEGEGGGSPQKVTKGDKGEVPCFNQR